MMPFVSKYVATSATRPRMTFKSCDTPRNHSVNTNAHCSAMHDICSRSLIATDVTTASTVWVFDIEQEQL